MARLDKTYIGICARSRGEKSQILDGYNTINDHLPYLLTIRLTLRNEDEDRSFRFYLSFLENITIVGQLKKEWNLEDKPSTKEIGWQLWTTHVFNHINTLC